MLFPQRSRAPAFPPRQKLVCACALAFPVMVACVIIHYDATRRNDATNGQEARVNLSVSLFVCRKVGAFSAVIVCSSPLAVTMAPTLLLCLLLASVSLTASTDDGTYELEGPYPDGDTRVPLYFSLIQSFSGQYISSYSLPGLQLALDLINNDTDLLPGYSLHFVITDTPVSSSCVSRVGSLASNVLAGRC